MTHRLNMSLSHHVSDTLLFYLQGSKNDVSVSSESQSDRQLLGSCLTSIKSDT